MNRKFIANIILVLSILAICSTITIQRYKIKTLDKECVRLKDNQEILITNNNALQAECRKYKVSDSLNAYKVSELRLMLSEYKKYRAEDLALIKKLEVDKSNLQRVIDSQANTIYELEIELKDTTAINENTGNKEQIKSFEYYSKWIDVIGQIFLNSNKVNLDINSREEIMVVESVEYKRFLGFLWKTKKIKKRDVDVISKNPNTEIIDVDYISVEN